MVERLSRNRRKRMEAEDSGPGGGGELKYGIRKNIGVAEPAPGLSYKSSGGYCAARRYWFHPDCDDAAGDFAACIYFHLQFWQGAGPFLGSVGVSRRALLAQTELDHEQRG